MWCRLLIKTVKTKRVSTIKRSRMRERKERERNSLHVQKKMLKIRLLLSVQVHRSTGTLRWKMRGKKTGPTLAVMLFIGQGRYKFL